MYQNLFTAAKVLGDSTIAPDTKNLGAGTIASVVITGIVVVFLALVLLILLVSLYGKIFESINKSAEKKKAAEKAAEAEAAKPVTEIKEIPAVPQIESGIEEETVAVIMAAVAAMESGSGKKLVLRSVKTAKPQRPAWSVAGITENTRPF